MAYLLLDVQPVTDENVRVSVKQTDNEKILNLAQDIIFANNIYGNVKETPSSK